MPRPEIEPHLRRLLTDEATVIGSLFQISEKGIGPFFCSLYAPGDNPAKTVLSDGVCYAAAEGPTPEDAIHEARSKLWGGL